jgi:Holliday junction resolvase RusA-like endonuclease
VKGGKYKKIAFIYPSSFYKKHKNNIVSSFFYQTQGYTFDCLVDITYYYKAPENADSDNVQKVLQDALEDAGIIKDDKLIRNIHMIRYYHPQQSVLIFIKKVEDENPCWPTGDEYTSLQRE